MKYLRKFETEADVRMIVQPNVVLIGDEGRVLYNVETIKGAFIQHINGGLYSTEEWTVGGFASDEANGVAVISDNAKFVIGKTSLGKMSWSSDTSNAVEGVMLTNVMADAKTDYAGRTNTALIAVDDTSGAALACANYTFPNGLKGYLPAIGELVEANKFKADINTALTLIGGEGMTGTIWSSTQYEAAKAWCHGWGFNGSPISYSKTAITDVRAFSAL